MNHKSSPNTVDKRALFTRSHSHSLPLILTLLHTHNKDSIVSLRQNYTVPLFTLCCFAQNHEALIILQNTDYIQRNSVFLAHISMYHVLTRLGHEKHGVMHSVMAISHHLWFG